jgi:hypothetical protein
MEWGVSFSLHRCSELGLNKQRVFRFALKDLGFKRLRLMSYWNIHEPRQGEYNFSELDWQMDMTKEYGAKVSLCLGLKQPRWPEFHMPKWAENLDKKQWHEALLKYIEVVVKRYKNHPALESWQLENEALLKTFGHGTNIDFDRSRIKKEYVLVKSLDKKHPVVMTLSDSWGIPWFSPKPDLYAVSLYRITMPKAKGAVYSKRPASFYKFRARLVKLLKRRDLFIHELQAEPWFNRSIKDMSINEQLKQMSPNQLKQNLQFAQKSNISPAYLWGLEWWYWLKRHGHEQITETVRRYC